MECSAILSFKFEDVLSYKENDGEYVETQSRRNHLQLPPNSCSRIISTLRRSETLSEGAQQQKASKGKHQPEMRPGGHALIDPMDPYGNCPDPGLRAVAMGRRSTIQTPVLPETACVPLGACALSLRSSRRCSETLHAPLGDPFKWRSRRGSCLAR